MLTERPVTTYDPLARAAYIRLADGAVVATRRITDDCLVDLDADCKVLGIELLNVRWGWAEPSRREQRRSWLDRLLGRYPDE